MNDASTVVEKVVEKAYVPPHLRGVNKTNTSVASGFSRSKLHEDDEKADTKLKIKSSGEKKVLDAAGEKEKKIKNIKKV